MNEHLPSWLTLGAQVRYRSEGVGGIGFQEGSRQDYLLERYRFELGLNPLPWLGFFGEFNDSRAANTPVQDGSVKNQADVRQAYVRLGREDGWWDVKAGRQRLIFGSERVIGASEWGNTARVFDAVRLGIHHKNDRIDIFSSSVVVNDPTNMDHHLDGNNLHGIYGSFGSWIRGSKVEPYVLMRTSPKFTGEPGYAGKYRSYTYGLRSAGNVRQKWTYEAEALGQHGHIGTNDLSAWAGLVQIQRHFKECFWKPTLMGEANYASGDHSQHDGKVNTLDQLYPTNHGIYGIADQIGRRNTKNIRGGIWAHPNKWLTVKGEGHYFWLASRYDALYMFNGNVSVPAVAGGAKYADVGPEMDLLADVKLSKHYDIGGQYGFLFPGKFLEAYSKGAGHSFYAIFLDVHL